MYTSTSRLQAMPSMITAFGRASVLLSKLPGVATLFLGSPTGYAKQQKGVIKSTGTIGDIEGGEYYTIPPSWGCNNPPYTYTIQ